MKVTHFEIQVKPEDTGVVFSPIPYQLDDSASASPERGVEVLPVNRLGIGFIGLGFQPKWERKDIRVMSKVKPQVFYGQKYDTHSGLSENIGNHDDIATCVEYSYETGQVISGGWDRKIKYWDARSMKPLTCENTVSVAVESLSVNGFIAMVAVGLSVNMYDLRKFNDSFYSKSVDILIKCVRPYVDQGFAAGSLDGRVVLKYFKPSEQNNDGYAFRCQPKVKENRHDLATVNDIVFSPLICGAFVTGDNDGYVNIWNAQSKRRIFEMPKFDNSIASLSYNREGQFLAVASSYTYQEANELLLYLLGNTWTFKIESFFFYVTVQVNLDFSSEADMIRKFRAGLALQPIATTLFANSPFTEGKPNQQSS